MTVAQARANIALVKYWGKQAAIEQNLPATPSLSLTLKDLATTTTVHPSKVDSLSLNGESKRDTKIAAFLAALRSDFDIPPLSIVSTNNFPTGAGLASSASGFAALITAIDATCSLRLSPAERSGWARRGSASAARSIHGGYVSLSPPDWQAVQVAAPDHWPLDVVVAVTETGTKAVSSTKGMEISRKTSPYFQAWTDSTEQDFQLALEAVSSKDFSTLAQVAEHSCMKMHALMLSSKPALMYWNGGTIAAIQTTRTLQDKGIPAFLTIDAGPQVKVVCLTECTAKVTEALANTPGVKQVITTSLGTGAEIVDS